MKADQLLPARRLADLRPHTQSNPPHRILVVDDDDDVRCLNAEALIHSGYAVDGAKDGAAAWDALRLDSYDLMITDNTMPNLSGVELLKKLHGERMAIPVIMATGTLPTGEFTRQPWLRPAATLLKPYTVGKLLETVKAVLLATAGVREDLEPPNWQSPPSPDGLRFG